jgi:hypothetical protein
MGARRRTGARWSVFRTCRKAFVSIVLYRIGKGAIGQ